MQAEIYSCNLGVFAGLSKCMRVLILSSSISVNYLFSPIAVMNSLSHFVWQCVCDWDDRDMKFTEIEAVVRRQIKVRNGS